MAKAKSGKSSYVSAGIHSNVSRATLTDMRRNVSQGDRLTNKFNAYLKGQNPWMTIENPNKQQTNKRFIRVRANDLYGSPKERNKL